MAEERICRLATFGWLQSLEDHPKSKGRKSTLRFFRARMIQEMGLDWNEVGELASDRKKWKALTTARMSHLERWERNQGH